MRIIVTGAAGLLGRHIVAAMRQAGHEVVGIDRSPGAEIQADLTDLGTTMQLFAGADVVAHCAALPRPVGVAPAEVWRVNMAAAYNAITAAESAKAKLFIQASSFSVLGPPFGVAPFKPERLPVDEAQAAAPDDAYAVTKWLAEEMVEAAVRRGAFRALSLRLPWVQTAASFKVDVLPRRDGPDAWRDLWAYIDARDAAAGFVAALGWQGSGHLRAYLSAADTYSTTPSCELATAQWGPELGSGLQGFAAMIDTSLARTALDWRPQHSWRSYEGMDS